MLVIDLYQKRKKREREIRTKATELIESWVYTFIDRKKKKGPSPKRSFFFFFFGFMDHIAAKQKELNVSQPYTAYGCNTKRCVRPK